MSKKDYSSVKLSKVEARKLVARLAAEDHILLTKHGKVEMADEKPPLLMADLLNVLNSPDAKILDEGEPNVHGRFSYRVQTNKIMVVVGFSRKGDRIKIVTCWRKK